MPVGEEPVGLFAGAGVYSRKDVFVYISVDSRDTPDRCQEEERGMATVRVEEKLHTKLRKLSEAEHRPIGQVIEDAVAKYEKDAFWKGLHDDYARLRANPEAWADYQREVALWDSTANDGLEDEEPYYSPEEEEAIRAEAARTYGV